MTNDQRITKFQCPMTKQALRVLPNCPCSSDRLSIMLRDLLRHWSLVILPLLSLLRIDYQGDRSVVHQRHLHLRAEFTGLDEFAAQPFNILARIGCLDGDQGEQAALDGPFDLAVDGDGRG